VPILGAEPVELGLRGMEAELARRLREEPRADVLAFFDSLTDHGVATNPRFSNPWSAR
jgi:hypothetical protein